jgi:hypothetical protein
MGNPNAHRNGSAQLSARTHPGMMASGTSRPDRSSSAVKYASYSAVTRVVQNVTMPSAHNSIERIR